MSKTTLGKDEIGDLAISLQNVLEETAQQGQYHHALAAEIKANVEQPTIKLAERMTTLRRGIQAQVERSYRNKGLQEGHVVKVSFKNWCGQIMPGGLLEQCMQEQEEAEV